MRGLLCHANPDGALLCVFDIQQPDDTDREKDQDHHQFNDRQPANEGYERKVTVMEQPLLVVRVRGAP